MTTAPTPAVLRLAAFPAALGGGNPAGVVLEASALGEADMQRIATEVGYAETAFVVGRDASDARRFRMRYFSPTAEVPFCGHATIATAVALADRDGEGAFAFETPVGPVLIATAREDGRLTAAFTSVEPRVRPFEAPEELLDLLGVAAEDLDERYTPAESFAGNWHPIVVLRGDVFDSFAFEPDAVRRLMDARGWTGTVTVVRECGGEGDPAFEARNLFPVGVITEDPATGSAAASLGGWLRAVGAVSPPARVLVHQGRHVGRPSLLVVDIPVAGGVTVSGTAHPIE